MNPVTVELVLFSSVLALLLASLVGILWAWIWALRRIWKGQSLLENVRPSPLGQAPWGALTVFAVVLLYVLVNFSIARCYAAMTGRHPPRAAKVAEGKGEAGKPGKEQAEKEDGKEPPVGAVTPALKANEDHDHGNTAEKPDAAEAQTETELLVQLAIINILLLILVPALVRVTSKASLADLGLDFKNWKGQMVVGGVAALLSTPAVLAVQSLAVRIWPAHKHPVEDMILDEFTAGVAILAVLSTMILAPMIEELLFRGIVQRWLTRLFTDRPDWSEEPVKPILIDEIGEFWPADDLLVGPPGKTVLQLSANGSAFPKASPFSISAIVMTSLLFSAMHFPQWPAPIGIFLLSMALGAVYQKTGSLIAVITMHGLFNGFSTAGLLLVALDRQLQPHHLGAAQAFLAHLSAIVGVVIHAPG